jgi:hypothetical protein
MSVSAVDTASDPRSKLASVALTVVAGCFVTVVMLICFRRGMGALSQPLPDASLASVVLMALLTATLIRTLGTWAWPDSPIPRWLPSALVLFLASALRVPGTSAVGTTALAAAVCGDLFIAAAFQAGLGGPLLARLAWRPFGQRVKIVRVGEEGDSRNELPPDVLQSFSRRRTSSGGELIFGAIRATFSAGQRAGNYHVAFCPPLETAPEVTCEQKQGPPARIKVAQVFPHGARLELRLDEVAEGATEIVLQLAARCERALTSRGPRHRPEGTAGGTTQTPTSR